jgi:hypothetical protein
MQALTGKPDWAEARERFKRWWDRSETDRPVTVIRSRRAKPLTVKAIPPAPATPEAKWLDIDKIIERRKIEIAHTEYIGEAFPCIDPALGPGSLGTFLGSEPVPAMDTVWYHKCFDSGAAARAILDPGNRWWQWTLDFSRRITAANEGDFFPAFPDMIENLDTVAQLVGTIETVYAINDQPAEIHRLQSEVLTAFLKAYDELARIMFPAGDESVFMGFQIWAPGRVCKIQTDIAALLSPPIFRDFARPYFERQCAKLDHVLYHLDGPDAIYSLDILCEMDGIDAIQWVPGAGNPPAQDPEWDHIWKRILDSGKGLWAHMPASAAPDFVKRFGTRGVYLDLGWIEDAAEARALLKTLTPKAPAPKKAGAKGKRP